MFINLLAALTFFTAPYLLGNLLTLPIYSFRRQVKLLPKWSLGALIIFGLFFVIAQAPLIPVIITLTALTALISQIVVYRPILPKPTKQHIALISLIALISTTALILYRLPSPYPSLLNWDFLEHQTLVNELRQGKMDFFTTNLSATFTVNSYPPTFHTLLAWPEIIFNLPAYETTGYFWWLESLFFLLTVWLLAALVYKLTKNVTTTICFTIVESFVFASLVVYTPFMLLPQTLTALLATIAILTLIAPSPKPRFELLPLLILLPLMHYIIGGLALVIIAGVLLTLKFFAAGNNQPQVLTLVTPTRPNDYQRPLLLGAIVLTLVAITTGQFLPVNILGSEESQYFNFDLLQKFNLLREWSGGTFLVFGALGLWNTYKQRNKATTLFTAAALITLTAALIKFPYSLKLFTLGSHFLNLLIALGFSAIIAHIAPKALKILAVSLIAFAFAFIFILNTRNYMDILNYQGVNTQVSANEIAAAKFLATTYQPNVGAIHESPLIQSDPSTMGILEALSGLRSPGGVYASEKIRHPIYNLDPNFLNFLNSSNNQKQLLILSGRYFRWRELPVDQALSITKNIWAPSDLTTTDLSFITEFKATNPQYQELYRNPSLVILAPAT